MSIKGFIEPRFDRPPIKYMTNISTKRRVSKVAPVPYGILVFAVVAISLLAITFFTAPAKAEACYYDCGYYYDYPSYDVGVTPGYVTSSGPSYNYPSYDVGVTPGYASANYVINNNPAPYPQPYPQPYPYPALSVNCYVNSNSVNVGNTVTWYANVSGGNGSYLYSWTGTDSLYGNGQSTSKAYNYAGTKTATVTVTSGSQSASQTCGSAVVVYGYNYNYNPLSVSCSPGTSFAVAGQNVSWYANVSGGMGGYSFIWSGTDVLIGTNQTANFTYYNPGQKYAVVTVYSGGQSITRDCSQSVNIGIANPTIIYGQSTYVTQPVIMNGGNLEIACYADSINVKLGVPVTWAVEATGGNSQYAYSWTGSDGLSGTARTAVTAYNTPGQKNATVTITSGGISQSKLCGNVVNVAKAYTPTKTIVKTVIKEVSKDLTINQNDNQNISATSAFSLKNVPWGWVAILVILILIAMVIYLLFGRKDLKD